MAKTRITDEGLILTNDNGVDVMIKANHAATSDKYVLPPASDGTIGTGSGGGIESIVAGSGVTVDATDPANPIVSASGGGGGTTVIRTSGLVVASGTTANDTTLQVTVTPNKRYRVQGYVVTNEPSATDMRAAIHGGAHDGGEDLYPTGIVTYDDGGYTGKLIAETGAFGSVSNTSYCELIGTKGLHFDVCVPVSSETTLRMVYYNGSESQGYSITRGVMTVTQLD